MVWAVGRLRPAGMQGPWGRAVTELVLLQLGIGLANLFLLAPTAVQLTHLLVADLLWVATAKGPSKPSRARAVRVCGEVSRRRSTVRSTSGK